MLTSVSPTDLTNAQGEVLAPLLPSAKPGGRLRRWPLRLIVNGIFYVLRGGIAWRLLPREYPPWSTVSHYFRTWRDAGIWEALHCALSGQVRQRGGRQPTPSGAIIDSQSVKTTERGGVHGYDGAKKLSGRKRHLLVDTTDLVLTVVTHAANVQDRIGGKRVLERAKGRFPRLTKLWAAQGYAGTFRQWVTEQLNSELAIVQHPRRPRGVWTPADQEIDWATILEPRGFRGPLAKRWLVERTLAWISRCRRMSKDYAYLTASSEAMVYLAMIRLLVNRPAERAA